jgi:hypothetical protein
MAAPRTTLYGTVRRRDGFGACFDPGGPTSVSGLGHGPLTNATFTLRFSVFGCHARPPGCGIWPLSPGIQVQMMPRRGHTPPFKASGSSWSWKHLWSSSGGDAVATTLSGHGRQPRRQRFTSPVVSAFLRCCPVAVRTTPRRRHCTRSSLPNFGRPSVARPSPRSTNNNQAEYQGLLTGLRAAAAHRWPNLEVVGNSALILRQMRKNARLLRLYSQARRLADLLGVRHWTEVRAHNKMADSLANLAMGRRRHTFALSMKRHAP